MPHDTTMRMCNRDFELALRLRMCASLLPGADSDGRDATTRKQGGFCIARHDAIRDALGCAMDRWGLSPVLYEQVVPQARPADPSGLPRLDIVTFRDGRAIH